MIASMKGNYEVVKALLARGAEVDLRDNDGFTALVLASARGHREVVKLLLAAGADSMPRMWMNLRL